MRRITFLLVLFQFFSFAQKIDLPTEYIRNQSIKSRFSTIQYEGSPYLNEQFVDAEVIVDGKDHFTKKLRYDAYSDVFELQENNNEITGLIKSANVAILMDNNLYELYKYLDDGVEKEGYFINLTKKKGLKLLKNERKKFIEAVKAESGYDKDKPAKFVYVKNYFLKKEGLAAVEMRLKKKSILKLLNDKEKLINSYIKKHKLKLKDEKEMIQLIDYYNTL